jgi:hypothetical protein
MALSLATLRPGLLVGLSISIVGNTKYSKTVIVADHVTEAGGREAEWQTRKEVEDAEEAEKAQKTRDAARGLITKCCIKSAFGLLCPEDKESELVQAVEAARAIAETFNEDAKLSRVKIDLLVGRIAQDDVSAVKALNSEVNQLMQQMQDGLRALNVDAVRDAANRAKRLGGMLSDQAQGRVKVAIDAARDAATRLKAQMAKAGEAVAKEIDLEAIRQIDNQRSLFLDLDHAETVVAPEEEAVQVELSDDEVDAIIDSQIANDDAEFKAELLRAAPEIEV